LWDDNVFLTDNPLIISQTGLKDFWLSTKAPDYFPLTSSMLWVEWRIFGDNPVGYRIVNILLHGISTILIFLILKELGIPGAFLCAALFGLHPVHVESVAWITQRKNALAMAFYLLTILCFVKSDKTNNKRLYILSLVFYILSLFSKTAVVTTPFVLLGCLLWMKRKIPSKDMARLVPFFVLSITLGIVTMWFQQNRAIAGDVIRTDGFLSRFSIAGRAVWFYIHKTIIPFNLAFAYPRWEIPSVSLSSFIPAIMILVLIILFFMKRKTWGAPFLFASGYFLITLFPVLGFMNIYYMRFSLVADHWQYFSSISIIALVVGGASWFVKKKGHALSSSGVIAGFLLVCLFFILTFKRNHVFKDPEILWRDNIKRYPEAWLSYKGLADTLRKRGKPEEAIVRAREAVRIKPDYSDAYTLLGMIHSESGDMEAARENYLLAVKYNPRDFMAHNNLGAVYHSMGEWEDAEKSYTKALELNPEMANSFYNLAIVKMNLRRFDEAEKYLKEALRLDPVHENALFDLAMIRKAQRDLSGAKNLLEQGIQSDPDFNRGRFELSEIFKEQGEPEKSIALLRDILKKEPDNSLVMSRLAWFLATQEKESLRNGEEAVRLAERACQITQNSQPLFILTLSAAYAEVGRFADAIETAEKAVNSAEESSMNDLASDIRKKILLYKQNKPIRD
ncbi:tetratricopeptide repeat protein, partial [Candidatus Sumerlaeota bacterium]|nr:tetratricopeptide repeat protein [Candidatus Sumerlaeota bacterium]